MASNAEYEVTERAGKRVAGRIAAKGAVLTLSPEEAEQPLREGTLVPRGKKLAAAYGSDSGTLRRMRREADQVRGRTLQPEAPEAAEAESPPAPAATAPADPAAGPAS